MEVKEIMTENVSIFKKGAKIEDEIIATENYVDNKIGDVDLSALETKSDAQAKLTEAKSYTDTKTTNMETTTGAQAKVNTHANRVDNPHSVTKAQIGLSAVLNYGVATQVEAQTGTSNAKYMTPLRTKEAIDKILGSSLTELNNHIVNKSNPHGVTKAQVGLGSVDNTKQMPINGGTFTGIAKAHNNTSYTVSQLRNVVASTSEPVSNQWANGDIWVVYE